MRRGLKQTVIGRTAVKVGAKQSAAYSVKVKLPAGLARGNYYISSCTPSGNGAGKYGCATAQDEVLVKGGYAVRGAGATAALKARAAQAPACSAGGRTLSKPGMKVYPETGNTGYPSVHTDVHIVYDAPSNLFLDGTLRRPAAARDAVPDRVQPRLRAHEHGHEHHGPRPEHDVTRSRSTASRRRSRSSSRPTPATRTARTIPTPPRTPRR